MVLLSETEMYDIICSVEHFKGKLPFIIKAIEDLHITSALLMQELNNLKKLDSNCDIIVEQLRKDISDLNNKINMLSEMCDKNTNYNTSTESKIKTILFVLSLAFGLYTAGSISLNLM